MSTSITAADLINAFKRRGVKYRFYKDWTDFISHNRNHAGANAGVTEGGFGPLKGVIGHNFGSSGGDTNQLAYLYRGDGPSSSKPGPLCLGGIVDDGTVVLIGWGAATHAGPADPTTIKWLEADAMPLDRERKPLTNGNTPGTKPVNPFYLGFEMCHGPEGPTEAQRKALVLATAAIMEMLGGPAKGYSGGSFAMHRELTTSRSDPQGVARDGSLRREVNALLKQWATAAPVTPAAPKPTTVIVTLDKQRITANQRVLVTSTVTPGVPGWHIFEWARPGSNTWTEFKRVDAPGATATAVSTPGSDVMYRVRFDPHGSVYAIDWSPNVPLDVVTLAEYEALEDEVAALRAQLAEVAPVAMPDNR